MMRIFLAILFFYQSAIAKTFPPGSTIKIQITHVKDNNNFSFDAEKGNPIPYEEYYLTDKVSTWRAVYLGETKNSRPLFTS